MGEFGVPPSRERDEDLPLSPEEQAIFDATVADIKATPAKTDDSNYIADDKKRPVFPQEDEWGVPPRKGEQQ